MVNAVSLLAVAAGGALGSVLRYIAGIMSGRGFGTDFPWGTLIVNVTGSALIGILAGVFALRGGGPAALRLFLVVGVCGGYTTFSTFSLDTWYLIERGAGWSSLGYMLASLILSVIALAGALQIARSFG